MKIALRLFLVAGFAVAYMSMIWGCSTKSSLSRFYILDSKAKAPLAERPFEKSVVVGPVRVPTHLERPNIVTRTGQNQLHFSEYHRWAGSLEENIGLVVAKDLAKLLDTDSVAYYLQHKRGRPWDYRVEIEIIQMDGRLGEKVSLEARWTIYGRKDKKTAEYHISRFEEDVHGQDYNSLIEAWNKTFSKLSGEIARALLKLHGS